ncbi:hypothetical protein CICLE_v10003339mg [Citrus x clementina]|uniref:Protein MIZU-KUSSEI 1 n=1 Tax=Citrus clementina TaxID=85681 RepID=V4T7Z2_CITCL|nr:protein MIZU-KUSSEI 1 [Citrus x clementina]ESR45641.1 hypothetical protein CICLE_v10003339mg [Citrus x clementina]
MTTTRSPPPPPPPPPRARRAVASPSEQLAAAHVHVQPTTISLQPSNKKDLSKSKKILRRVRSVFRSFPINIPPACKIPVPLHDGHVHLHGGPRMTGTLFGYRKARVNIVIQENPRCLPLLVLELAIPTGKLLQDMGLGLVRIALECEKKPAEKTKIIDEPIWTMYCNGRKSGYGVKRKATDEDLGFMQMLHGVSMGAGVLPTATDANNDQEGDLTYMRAQFERVIGSKDSETYYMSTPDGNDGPELTIFFVRV